MRGVVDCSIAFRHLKLHALVVELDNRHTAVWTSMWPSIPAATTTMVAVSTAGGSSGGGGGSSERKFSLAAAAAVVAAVTAGRNFRGPPHLSRAPHFRVAGVDGCNGGDDDDGGGRGDDDDGNSSGIGSSRGTLIRAQTSSSRTHELPACHQMTLLLLPRARLTTVASSVSERPTAVA